jgi:hypothetical protein
MCFDMPKNVNRHEILIDPLMAATFLKHETMRLLIYGYNNVNVIQFNISYLECFLSSNA